MVGNNIDLLILALIAAFLVFRLRSVLGRRHGEERQRPNPYASPPTRPSAPSPADNVIPMPNRPGPVEAPRVLAPPPPGEPVSLAQGLSQIAAADPSFNEKMFVDGARAAFEMIVGAFARADVDTLRSLLSPDVFANFSAAIAQRADAGERMDSRIHKFDEVDITSARMDGSVAYVTLRFQTQQVTAIRDNQDRVVDGDLNTPTEVVDVWTFARDTQSEDPNWLLVETRAA